MDYDCPSVPTAYAGTVFRSRLEARWAAFFNLCGWKWQYEPYRLPGWLVDFSLSWRIGAIVACEVKPIELYASDKLLRETFAKAIRPNTPTLLLGRFPEACDCDGTISLHGEFSAVGLASDGTNLVPLLVEADKPFSLTNVTGDPSRLAHHEQVSATWKRASRSLRRTK